jgi:cell wall-associated NlpC family hydrolase
MRGRYLPGLLALPALSMLAACASTGAVPRPFPTPGTSGPGRVTPPVEVLPRDAPATPAPPATPQIARGDGYAVTGTALSLRGSRYRNGGSDPSGFDCSGFVQYVFAQHGFGLPRDVRHLFATGAPVTADRLEPGDLLFFATDGSDVSHVAIAIGGDQFVHAPSSNGSVRVETLSSSYWAPRYVAARRVM